MVLVVPSRHEEASIDRYVEAFTAFQTILPRYHEIVSFARSQSSPTSEITATFLRKYHEARVEDRTLREFVELSWYREVRDEVKKPLRNFEDTLATMRHHYKAVWERLPELPGRDSFSAGALFRGTDLGHQVVNPYAPNNVIWTDEYMLQRGGGTGAMPIPSYDMSHSLEMAKRFLRSGFNENSHKLPVFLVMKEEDAKKIPRTNYPEHIRDPEYLGRVSISLEFCVPNTVRAYRVREISS